MIQFLDRVERLVDDVEHKLTSLDHFFALMDRTTDGLALITDRFVGAVTGMISRIFRKREKEEMIDE